MNIGEILENAPRNATHYRVDILTGLVVYIRNYQKKWCEEFIDDSWQFVCVHEIFEIKPL